MKIWKKLLAAGLCLAVLQLPVQAVEENPFGMLEKMEIMKKETADGRNAESTVSRAEMTQYVINMLQLRGVKMGLREDERYTDVFEDHENYDAIVVAKLSGLAEGHGDGTFAPDAPVTGAQTAKLVVSMLGYAPQAEREGGYPHGYLKVAAEIGLTAGLQLENETCITRQTAAQLLYTAAYLPVMEQTTFREDADVYTVMDGVSAPLLRFCDKYKLPVE